MISKIYVSIMVIYNILLTNMLAYLVIHSNSVTFVTMEVIDYMKCQIHHLHFEQCNIKQKQENNCQYLCYHLCASTSVDIYFWEINNIQHLMLANPEEKKIYICNNNQ